MAEQMIQHKEGEKVATQAIPTGYKLTEVGVIPQDWNVSMLRDISSKITDGTHDTPKPVIEGIPFLTAIHVKDGKIDFDGCYFLPESIHNEIYRRCNPEFGDILMVNIGSGTATTAVVNVDYEFSLKNVALIKPNKENNGFYINYALSFSKNKIIDTILTGGAQPFLSLTQIALLQVPVPSREEQTTIANVLSDTDALIVGLELLIAKKQAIKTATMQQLLTGRTRLPQFALRPDGTLKGYKSSELGHIPEDWHEVSLSSVTKNIDAGVSVNSIDQLDAYGHGKHVLKTSCVNGGVFNCLEAKSIIPSDIGRAKCFPREGNIIVSRMNTPALVGEIGYIEKSLPGYFLPDRLWQVSFREDAELNTKWLMYVLAHPINAKKIKESATGTSNSMKNISKNAFLALNFYKPNIEEQTAIATILSDMDSELNALKQKLAKARDVKQGMMQQLLTGRIRLPVEQVE
ncbi:restriction endonuclease subunit S [Aeromonas veronii]|uniref:restriction endonuclease subunit S n=1 Tax=Aeromonas veronii TaxID=654 RepID=UPI00191F7101|nr:restriction endonuclease subunit S [Aeromonas veronii]MBL0564227.1 restriction endonuclease subunit S [Aeromonas veronii]